MDIIFPLVLFIFDTPDHLPCNKRKFFEDFFLFRFSYLCSGVQCKSSHQLEMIGSVCRFRDQLLGFYGVVRDVVVAGSTFTFS